MVTFRKLIPRIIPKTNKPPPCLHFITAYIGTMKEWENKRQLRKPLFSRIYPQKTTEINLSLQPPDGTNTTYYPQKKYKIPIFLQKKNPSLKHLSHYKKNLNAKFNLLLINLLLSLLLLNNKLFFAANKY